jgi:hypothetical protein
MNLTGTAVLFTFLSFSAPTVWAQTAPAPPPATEAERTGEPLPATEAEGFGESPAATENDDGNSANFAVIALVAAIMAIVVAVWLFSTPPDAARAGDRARPQPDVALDEPPTPSAARSAATAKGASIFISYRREDSADIVGRISDRLVERFGKTAVFKDVDSIPIGRDFRTHLQEAVGRCDALIVIIGKQWCDASVHGKRRLDDARDHLRIEVESALARNIPVIPVLVQGASMPEEEMLPESLRALAYRNGIPVRPDPDFNLDLDRLMRGMEAQFDSPPLMS